MITWLMLTLLGASSHNMLPFLTFKVCKTSVLTGCSYENISSNKIYDQICVNNNSNNNIKPYLNAGDTKQFLHRPVWLFIVHVFTFKISWHTSDIRWILERWLLSWHELLWRLMLSLSEEPLIAPASYPNQLWIYERSSVWSDSKFNIGYFCCAYL